MTYAGGRQVSDATGRFRLLCTNDFSGAWDPARASNGWLPGAQALREVIELMRADGATLWVDAGDLVDGGAVAAADRGASAWRAAATLGIDVAVPGNHEFDWGIPRFQELVADTGMTYLCANADLGLPGTTLVDTLAGKIGIVGVTCPEMAELCPEFAEVGLRPVNDVIMSSARALRHDGAEFVVAVVHDGVAPDDDLSFLGEWYRDVDAVVGGHTLWRWIGQHDRTAVCQPAAYGAEVGVIEFRRGQRPEVWAVPVEAGARWDGPGAEHLDNARSVEIGTVSRALVSRLGRPNELLDGLAKSMASVAGADAAIASLWDCFVTQPIDNGILTYLPEGRLTLADLLRCSPHASEPVAVLDLTASEFEQAQCALTSPFLDTLGVYVTSGSGSGTVRVALTERQAASIAALLGPGDQRADRSASTLLQAWSDLLAAT
ncbi:MAG: metallophosphoesterase [Nocardioidaceae bacterium]|nr:metallophosphoesterase [Nocardioidaceae bacterium]